MQGDSPRLVDLFITPPEAERSMLPLISKRPLLTRDSLSQSGGGGLTCFSSFVAGSGSLHTSSQRTRALPFRCSPTRLSESLQVVFGFVECDDRQQDVYHHLLFPFYLAAALQAGN